MKETMNKLLKRAEKRAFGAWIGPVGGKPHEKSNFDKQKRYYNILTYFNDVKCFYVFKVCLMIWTMFVVLVSMFDLFGQNIYIFHYFG